MRVVLLRMFVRKLQLYTQHEWKRRIFITPRGSSFLKQSTRSSTALPINISIKTNFVAKLVPPWGCTAHYTPENKMDFSFSPQKNRHGCRQQDWQTTLTAPFLLNWVCVGRCVHTVKHWTRTSTKTNPCRHTENDIVWTLADRVICAFYQQCNVCPEGGARGKVMLLSKSNRVVVCVVACWHIWDSVVITSSQFPGVIKRL